MIFIDFNFHFNYSISVSVSAEKYSDSDSEVSEVTISSSGAGTSADGTVGVPSKLKKVSSSFSNFLVGTQLRLFYCNGEFNSLEFVPSVLSGNARFALARTCRCGVAVPLPRPVGRRDALCPSLSRPPQPPKPVGWDEWPVPPILRRC